MTNIDTDKAFPFFVSTDPEVFPPDVVDMANEAARDMRLVFRRGVEALNGGKAVDTTAVTAEVPVTSATPQPELPSTTS